MDRSESGSTSVPRNRLLAVLPPDILAGIYSRMESVDLLLHQVIHPVRSPITAVYFPMSGWASILAYMDDSEAVEVGMIDRDGMVGLPLLFGADHDDLEAMTQAPGTALRMEAEAFREELERTPEFRTILLRYALVHHGQVARTAACNGRHSIQQRLARWLLIAHDRADEDHFPMTHEFLSMMLGVRRAGISVAAGAFQKAELIRYERGRMEIVDRTGLEKAVCECYRITRRMSDALLGVESARHL